MEPIVVCRAGIGDPLARGEAALLERDPRAVVEGLVRAARAAGAGSAHMYLAARAADCRETLLREVGRLHEDGETDIEIEVLDGPAALVCAEESAFLRALEGCRPVPDFSPPAPDSPVAATVAVPTGRAERAAEAPRLLFGKPVVFISLAESIGAPGAPALVPYTLAGDVLAPGAVEAPPGATLRELVFEYGGGPASAKDLKAVAVGGPTGGWLPPSLLDLPATDEALRAAGTHLGAGTIVAVAHPACAVHLARGALEALARENCGKCVVCREGTMQMAEILGDVAEGKGRPGDIDLLHDLARGLRLLGTCDWGRTAADPVLTALAHFCDDFEAHVRLKGCPAGVCSVGAV